jgi:hypothetical protein
VSNGVQNINWAKKYRNGYDSSNVVVPDTDARLTNGFDGGFAAGFARINAVNNLDPVCYQHAQSGSKVLDAIGQNAATTDSETLDGDFEGDYTKLKTELEADGGTMSSLCLVCDYGQNEILTSIGSGTPSIVETVDTSVEIFINSYKSLIRIAAADGVKGMVINKVLAMSTDNANAPANYSDPYVLAYNSALEELPQWASDQSLSIGIKIALTFEVLGGLSPNTDYFESATTDLHQNALGGLVQSSATAGAFSALIAELSGGTRTNQIISNNIIS